MIGVLITDGGTHSAEKLAEATASHIVDIANHVAGEKRAAAVKLQAAIIDILERHHATVQSGEQSKIAEHSHDRLAHDNDPSHHLEVDEVAAEIIAASVGTPWEADFAKAEMLEHLAVLLNQHFKHPFISNEAGMLTAIRTPNKRKPFALNITQGRNHGWYNYGNADLV